MAGVDVLVAVVDVVGVEDVVTVFVVVVTVVLVVGCEVVVGREVVAGVELVWVWLVTCVVVCGEDCDAVEVDVLEPPPAIA